MPSASRTRLLAAAAMLAVAAGASAQVLARPGWAGSGVAPDPWWRRAVLYRLDPARFQDSDGDGVGDLAGLAARLDYLQSLGIDGLLLDAAQLGGTPEAPGFGDVVREASRRGIRLLIVLPAGDPQLAANVRRWLNAGVAGIYLSRPSAGGGRVSAAAFRELRQTAAAFPGERILAADPAAIDGGSATVNLPAAAAGPTHRRTHPRAGADAGNDGSRPQLTATAPLLPPPAATGAEIAIPSLRYLLSLAAGPDSSRPDDPGEAPLLRLPLTAAQPPIEPRAAALWRTLATMELAARGAAIIDFGAELGLNTAPPAAAAGPVLMQWTPQNRTAPPPAPIERSEPATPAPPVYGTYHPYIRPPRGIEDTAPALPKVTVSDTPAAPVTDPDTLMGFTSGELPTPPVDGSRLNAAVEDTDPGSLLNFYRRLIALHHDNATLRNGTLQLLDAGAPQTAPQVLAWVREAPSGSRTAHSVVIVCNLGAEAATLNLNPALARMHLRPGALRELLTSSPVRLTGETTQRLQLPPYTVFFGELAAF